MSSAPPTRLQPDGIDLIASQRKAIDEALASDRSVTPTSLVGGDRRSGQISSADPVRSITARRSLTTVVITTAARLHNEVTGGKRGRNHFRFWTFFIGT